MEIINVFDENHNLLGTSTKQEAHQKGLWHETFLCLFINSKKNKVYLQYKNNKHNELSNLNKIDISVGGHLLSNETKEDGIREIKEESSLQPNINDLIYAGERIINKKIKEDFIIKEFVYIYLYDKDFNLAELKSEDDEVLYFIEFDIDELLAFVTQKTKSIYGITPIGTKKFYIDDFIKGYMSDDQLYYRYLLLAKKIKNNEKNILWKDTFK